MVKKKSGRRRGDAASWVSAIGHRPSTIPSASLDDREDVVLAHQEVHLAVDLELVTGIRGEEHLVAGLDLEWPTLAVLGDAAVADSDHLALLRLVLGGIRQHDAAGRLLLGLLPLDDHPIPQGLQLHRSISCETHPR